MLLQNSDLLVDIGNFVRDFVAGFVSAVTAAYQSDTRSTRATFPDSLLTLSCKFVDLVRDRFSVIHGSR